MIVKDCILYSAKKNYIDMEYSIGLNFVFDKEFFKYHIFEELYGALFSIDMEYSTR